MEPHVVNKPVARSHFWLIVGGIIGAVILGLISFVVINARTRTLVGGLVSDPAESLQTTDGRTNLVFLGMGGEGHQAPDLTDSIIVVSLRHSDHQVTMLSLPRDIWVDTLKARVNTAYHYGNEKRKGAGLDLAKSAVSEIVGIPIHYAVALDFNGFIKAIDAVGGIDVVVERTFDDYKYPIPGKENVEPESDRYEHIHFDQGTMHMDGVTALKFARSRHALGDEGTDFARGERQQKIILAFKDKLLQSQSFLNSDTIKNVIHSFSASLDTNLGDTEYGSLLRYFVAFHQADVPVRSLNIEGYLVNPKNTAAYGGAWVLVPEKNWQEIHDYVQESLE